MKQKIFRRCFVLLLLVGTFWTANQLAFATPTAHAQADFTCANVSEISLIECEVLVAIFDANPDGQFSSSWFSSNTPCSWDNIYCTDGQVTELYSGDNQLTDLPPEIGNLPALEYLYLSDNQLTSLPPEVGNLSNLRTLYLGRNALTSLPPEIGNLPALEYLGLSDNQLTTLPPEIGNLPPYLISQVIRQDIEIEGYYPSLGVSCINLSEIPRIECEALAAIYEANSVGTPLNSWPTIDTPCNRSHISCVDGHVSVLTILSLEP